MPVALIENEAGASPYVILVDHASRHIPAEFGDMGLGEAERRAHIAWDPGALDTARLMARDLDACLVHAGVSRLVLDLNRDPSAPDSIATMSETTVIPGNEGISDAEKSRRAATFYTPYHAAIAELLDRRAAQGRATALVAMHSFTPVYRGVARPWPVGVLFDTDERLSAPLIELLGGDGLMVGVNEPYGPWDRVYHTLGKHAGPRGLPSVMIEVRNDEIADAPGQEAWARRLAGALVRIAGGGAPGHSGAGAISPEQP
jgi:predicted N-formylglutamate amidohydrolase